MKKEFILMTLYFVILLFGGLTVSAATRTVDNISDNGALTNCTVAENDCSLRGAIAGAASGDTVDFDANVSISGKVFTPQGAGLTNAFVILTDQDGNSRTARTTSFGYFRFDEVEAGQIYIISVNSKRYQFTPQVLTINEDIADLILTANQ